MATLTIQLPGLPPVAHVLKDDTITVGRMKGNNITIDDESVSLTHARITRKNGEFYLKDLNSTNGTVVNGQRINEVRLHDFDRVSFAKISAQFALEAVIDAVTAPPQPVMPPAPVFAQSSPSAPPTRSPAPAHAAPPSRTPYVDRPRKSLIGSLVPYLGGAVALAVVGIIAWKIIQTPGNDSTAAPSSVVTADSKKMPSAPQPAASSVPQTAAKAETADQSITSLVKSLKDPDAAERRRAAAALHSLGSQAREAAPALREALSDSDADVRMWAALTLVNNDLHDKATIPILVGVLHRENPMLRQVACLSLGLISYEGSEKESVVLALTEAASKDGDEEVRKAAVSALNIIAPEVVARFGNK